MFGRQNIETIIRNGDPKKLAKAVRKNPDVVMKIIHQENWDALNKVLYQEPGIVADRIICNGDLNALKKIIEAKPDLLRTYFTQYDYTEASLLHIAAKYDQTAMIDFLVNEKGVRVDKLQKNNWTPLHFAAENGAQAALKKLLELGANPDLIADRKTAYQHCSDPDTKEFFLSCLREREKPSAKAKIETKVADAWKSSQPDVVVHEHEIGRFRLTDAFNFTTETWERITEKLDNGDMKPETKTFDDATPKMIAQARAELDRLNGAAPAKAAPARTKTGYTDLSGAGL